MNITQTIVQVLDESLNLNGRAGNFTRATPLLGALPELDSMAVVTLVMSLEEQFDMVMPDDEIDGAIFATLGSLTDYVSSKLAA